MRLKSIEQCVVAVLSAHISIHCRYLGRFYVRSEVIHKSLPDHCVGKSVLHGKILHKNFDLIYVKSSHIAKVTKFWEYFTYYDVKSSHD